MLKFLALATIFALSAVVVAGCGIFDPKKSGGPPPILPPEYEIPFNPTVVLTNLGKAYSARDSVGYKVIYDSSYVGTSMDLGDPPGTTPISLTYDNEVEHIANLARTHTISSVLFDLGPLSSWDRLPSSDPSHPEWAVIQISGSSVRIEITDGINIYTTTGANEFLEFMFKPTTPAAVSPTDTLWNIVKWTETREADPGP